MANTSYAVTRQATDTYDFTVPGDPVLGTQVYFSTGAGNVGSVFVPQTVYNAKTVATMVQAQANVIDAVGALSTHPAT
jgi:hypothetical protein